MKNYRINNHGNLAKPQWSVDQYDDDDFINQEAFFYRLQEEAEKRAEELAEADRCEYRGVRYRCNAAYEIENEQRKKGY